MMRYSLVIKLSLLALIVISVSSCGEKEQKTPPPPDITVTKVLQQDVPIYKEFVGQIYGVSDIPIRARVEGWLEQINFNEGRPVRKGQLLYEVDKQPFEAKVAEALSNLAAAQTELINAENEYNRYRPLAEKNAVSQSDYDAALAYYEAARAQVDAAKANLKSAEIQLGYTSIYSPINGIIGKTQARVGEFVGREPNPVILNVVSRIDSIRVEFFLSEADYLRLARYAMSRGNNLKDETDPKMNPNLELLLADGSYFEYKGWTEFIDREVNPGTGSVLIQAIFPNPDRLLRPGQFARVKAVIEEVPDAILVPQKCVVELQGRYNVYKLVEENKVMFQPIEVVTTFGDTWLVKEGLEKGDKVVMEGLQFVKSDMIINPVEKEFESQSDLINKD
jgi:membrane fusion protein (multidrug efflux system)